MCGEHGGGRELTSSEHLPPSQHVCTSCHLLLTTPVSSPFYKEGSEAPGGTTTAGIQTLASLASKFNCPTAKLTSQIPSPETEAQLAIPFSVAPYIFLSPDVVMSLLRSHPLQWTLWLFPSPPPGPKPRHPALCSQGLWQSHGYGTKEVGRLQNVRLNHRSVHTTGYIFSNRWFAQNGAEQRFLSYKYGAF